MVPPIRASVNPMIDARDKCSLSSIGESSATQSGPVATNTAELATLVYSREEIHVAKWAARNRPETIPNVISLRVRVLSS